MGGRVVWGAALAAILVAGCAADVVPCGKGWCPEGLVCGLGAGGDDSCLVPSDGCEGFPDQTPCQGAGLATCQAGQCRESFCGDGILDPSRESCDEGPANSDEPGAGCRTTCEPAGCGDGIIDPGIGGAPGEICDEGAANSDVRADACRSKCTPAMCGDGVGDEGERPACFVEGEVIAPAARQIVVLELDGDLRADLAVLDESKLRVLLAGATEGPQRVDDSLLAIAAFDSDGGGVDDLVAVRPDAILVLENPVSTTNLPTVASVAGVWTQAPLFAVVPPTGLALHERLLVGDPAGDTVTLYERQGDLLVELDTSSFAGDVLGLASGDFDQDGFPDAFVAVKTGLDLDVDILRVRITDLGVFGAPDPLGSVPGGLLELHAADVHGGLGDDAIAVTAGAVHVMSEPLTPIPEITLTVPVPIAGAVVADFDGDDRADLVLLDGDQASTGLGAVRGGTVAALAELEYTTLSTRGVVADLDLDGFLDLVHFRPGGTVRVARSGDGPFGRPRPLHPEAGAVAVIDVDGAFTGSDDDADPPRLLVARGGVIFMRDAEGVQGSESPELRGLGKHDKVASGPWDRLLVGRIGEGDGEDLLAQVVPFEFAFFPGESLEAGAEPSSGFTLEDGLISAQLVEIVDGSPGLELAGCNKFHVQAYSFDAEGAVHLVREAPLPGTFCGALQVGDVTGDGVADVLLGAEGLWLYTGGDTWGPATLLDAEALGDVVALVDLDGTPPLEVAYTTGEALVVRSAVPGAGARATLPLAGAYRILPADVNLDDHQDLIVMVPGLPRAAVWIVMGEAGDSYAPPWLAGSVTDYDEPALGDLDGDGAPDLIVPGIGLSVAWGGGPTKL